MVATVRRSKRKLIIAIAFALLMIIPLGFILTVTNYFPKPYPNLERHDAYSSSRNFDLEWVVSFTSNDKTIDSYEMIHDWYEQNGNFDFIKSLGPNYDHFSWFVLYRIPMTGSARITEQVFIYECLDTKAMCVSTHMEYGIEFSGLFGEMLSLILSWF